MNNLRTPGLLASSIALALGAGPALATNGYFAHGYGEIKGMAGAGSALALDSLAAAINPAGMAFVDEQLDVGLAFFFPKRGFTANSLGGREPIPAGEYDSDNDWFAIPHFGYNHKLDKDRTIGISVGGNGGMNTEYDAAVFYNFGVNPATGDPIPGLSASSPTGINLEQLFIAPTYTQKLSETSAFGVTPVILYQRLEVQGLEPFRMMSIHPGEVTNNGTDASFGYGLKLGWMGQLTPELSAGIAYQSRIYADPFEKYKGLLAEEGDFDLPPVVNMGIAYKATPDVTVALDVQKFFYSDVAAVGNSNAVPLMNSDGSPRQALGTDDGLGFGWEDQTVWKLGVQWRMDERYTLRAGYSKADQVVPGAQALFNILAPAVVTQHLTLAVSRQIDERNSLNLSYMHAIEEKVSGTNPNTGPQTGFVEMAQDELQIGWSRKF